jgi:hypothetical protein
VAFGVIVITWDWLALSFNTAYVISGGLTAAIALACMVFYPQFQSPTPQHKTMRCNSWPVLGGRSSWCLRVL